MDLLLQALDVAFYATLAALALLHVAVYLAPLKLVRFNALPWAFRIDFNTDLDFQSVTYATVHESWQARYSHLTLPLEYLAWMALLWMLHPVALVLVTLAVIAVYAQVEERGFALMTAIAAIALGTLGALAVEWIGASTLWAPLLLLLLIAPAVRVVGHTFDPIPPWIGAERDGFMSFRDAKLGWRLPFVLFMGWLSECAASLPFRLFWVQLFWAAQRLGYRNQTLRPWPEAAELAARIRAEGWSAWPRIGDLFRSLSTRE
jgi:hypothetical protein